MSLFEVIQGGQSSDRKTLGSGGLCMHGMGYPDGREGCKKREGVCERGPLYSEVTDFFRGDFMVSGVRF